MTNQEMILAYNGIMQFQNISVSLRPGKSMEEYQRKLNELAIQETDFEPKKVSLSLFEGLDLTSAELEPFIFMISED